MTTSLDSDQIRQRTVFGYMALRHFLGRQVDDGGSGLKTVEAERDNRDLVLHDTDTATFAIIPGMRALVRAGGTEREFPIEGASAPWRIRDAADATKEITSICILHKDEVVALGPRLAPAAAAPPVEVAKKGDRYSLTGALVAASRYCVVMPDDRSASEVRDVKGGAVEVRVPSGGPVRLISFFDASDQSVGQTVRLVP